MHWFGCRLIVWPAWWLLNLLSLRHSILSSFRTRTLRILSKYPTLWWQKTVEGGAQSLLGIKLGDLKQLRESSSEQQWSHLHCCNSPWYFQKHGAVHVQYMLHGWGGVHALQLLETRKHSYMYFIDFCWLLDWTKFLKSAQKTKMLSNPLNPILRGRKGAETWNMCKKCKNPIKGAINNAYFTAFLVLKCIINLSACKLLYFLKRCSTLKSHL